MRRSHDAVGVDPIDFESGNRKPVCARVAFEERPPAPRSSAPAVCDAAALEVTMPLADAASVADGNLDTLGGGLEHHRATRMARSDVRRARGAARSGPVSWEGIAAKRGGGA